MKIMFLNGGRVNDGVVNCDFGNADDVGNVAPGNDDVLAMKVQVTGSCLASTTWSTLINPSLMSATCSVTLQL